MAQLEKEKADLRQALAEGHDLLQQGSAPEFMEHTVHDLEDRLKDTERLTAQKQKTLTVSEIRVFDGESGRQRHISVLPQKIGESNLQK